MKKRSVFLTGLFLVFALSLVGCGPKKAPQPKPQPISDEIKIKAQMDKWAEAWETKDPDNFSATMVDYGIIFTYEDESLRPPEDEPTGEQPEEMTIDEFIALAQRTKFWVEPITSRVNIYALSVDGTVSVANGKWIIGHRMSSGSHIFLFEAVLVKKGDNWFIKTFDFQDFYEGDQYEVFDPSRHKAYVSFSIGDQRYVFHDQYTGNSPRMSSIVTYNKEFSVDASNYDTKERFILSFDYDGDHPRESVEFSRITWSSNEEDWCGDSRSFTVVWNKCFEEDIVQGKFFGWVSYNDGKIEITDGFFYINHEFNLPEVTIESPNKDGDEVKGTTRISGTAEDDSELLDVIVSVYRREENGARDYIIDRLDAEGTESWCFTFDSRYKYDNRGEKLGPAEDGEYWIRVFARDIHYNYSEVVERRIIIKNAAD